MNELAIDYLQQAITLMGKPNYYAAEELVKKAIELEPRYKEAHSTLGDIYVNLDEYTKALEAFKTVMILDPEDAENYFNMGGVYILLDDLPKGIELYNMAEEKGYEEYQLFRNLAKIYRELGSVEQAIRNFNKAIKAAPLFSDLRLEKSSYYLQLGRFNEALETLDELQKLEPDLFDTYAIKAEIYCGLKQYDKAVELVDVALASFPEDAALMTLKAKILIQIGKYEEADILLNEAESSDQFGTIFKNCLLLKAQIKATNNQLKEAAIDLSRIIEMEETYDEEANFLLMNVYYGMGDYEKTLDIAKKLSQREEANLYTVTAKYYVPVSEKKMGRDNDALLGFKRLKDELRRITVRHPHLYEAYLYRLLCHNELKEYEKALELAEYIEALDEHSSDAYSMRYVIYKDMGDEENAQKMKDIVAKMNPGRKL